VGGGWGGLGQPASQGQRSEQAGWAGKEEKKEIHSKLISRFRKTNKEIQVTEIIGKNAKNSQKIWEVKDVNLSEFWSTRIWGENS
jgi:hypothetical protein